MRLVYFLRSEAGIVSVGNASLLESHPASYFQPAIVNTLDITNFRLYGNAGGVHQFGIYDLVANDFRFLIHPNGYVKARSRLYIGSEGREFRLDPVAGGVTGQFGILDEYADAFRFVISPAGNFQLFGDVYIGGNCSVASLTDRTPAYTGDALMELATIGVGENGEIDHATLPQFARHVRTEPIYEDREIEKEVIEGGKKSKKKVTERIKVGEKAVQERNIGNMVSILTTAVQQLIGEIDTMKKEIAKLKGAA